MNDPFRVTSLAQAKSIILTPEDGDTETRWRKETPYLANLIDEYCEHGLMLDYGCGVGRLAKELISRRECHIVGADTSPSMRALAAAYVEHPCFAAVDPTALSRFFAGVEFDTVLAIWTLQHIPDVRSAVEAISNHARIGGRLFVVNNLRRALPNGNGGWRDDGINVRELLRETFTEVAFGDLDPARTTPRLSRMAFWAVYET